MDAGRFRVDLGSHAIVEAFGADLELARSVAQDGGRTALPALQLANDRWVVGAAPYDEWRAAALAAGATPTGEPAPGVEAALSRFGSMATAEVAAVCDLPGPRAEAELWRLATEWRVKPERVLTGVLWKTA